MPVSVRLLSKFARLGASSRLRMLQYLPTLDRFGITVDHHPLLSDAYVKALYEGKSYASRVLAGGHYVKRIHELLRTNPGDLDWVEGEFLPFLPRSLEKAFMRGSRPFIAEYDDALFHRYDISSSAVVRSMLGNKIDAVMRDAACVIAGNRYLAERAQSVGAARVEVIPTVVNADRYKPVVHKERERLVIGWIGSPVTQHYLYALHGALREVCARHGAFLRLIGARPEVAERLPGVPLECVPWTEQDEVALLSGMDVGIMPLLDGPWERGKCGYKLVQYMACGLPVLASPIGVNSDLVKPDVNGFLPVSSDDWIETLSLLLSSVEVRQRLGMAGRARVEAELCVQVQAPRLAEVMHGVAGR
ncbi:glycosyltransferase family 4 protein [Dyella jiangningensis]|uniref:Glycosyl transferase family 1 n=1 Tax=Dyella jiangningensis TaxID=1379159 RepID=A0A328P4Q2_9GAMM|nr:glycosyltransferase family 4 protein [Dyella jiangningensis]RAO75555.1 glycosyl transferase family 1 [Dyella jiangningensis]